MNYPTLKILAVATLLTVAANSCCAHHVAQDSNRLAGGFTELKSVTPDDQKVFYEAYNCKAQLVPIAVATQVVAGMNYSFLCTDANGNEVNVLIYKPLPNQGEARISAIEPITGYQDIVKFIKQGFADHWQSQTTDERGLSAVYNYVAPSTGYAVKDINNDGVAELIIADSFNTEGTEHAVYDLFTYDTTSGKVVHVLSGGERDRFTITVDGTIIEEGSNSADDSFTKFYQLNDAKLVEQNIGNLPTPSQNASIPLHVFTE